MSVRSRLTRNQALVLATLDRAEGPLSAYRILDTLREEGFRAPLQVYRALDKLQELGLVHRLESLSSFVACAHPDKHCHSIVGFAICDRCGHVDEFTDAELQAKLDSWVKEKNFRPAKTTIEISGVCAGCTQSPESA